MSARRPLFNAIVAPLAAGPMSPHDVARMLDNYRAEVLREAADAIALDRDATLPSGGQGAYRRGMTRAIDLLRRMADEARPGTCGRALATGQPCPNHPRKAELDQLCRVENGDAR